MPEGAFNYPARCDMKEGGGCCHYPMRKAIVPEGFVGAHTAVVLRPESAKVLLLLLLLPQSASYSWQGRIPLLSIPVRAAC